MQQFRDAADQVPIDWPRLKHYLAGVGLDLALESAPRQFAWGMGNLNFLITVDDKPMVLRRPPLGPIPPGANDMKREDRVLSRLWEVFPLAPRSWAGS